MAMLTSLADKRSTSWRTEHRPPGPFAAAVRQVSAMGPLYALQVGLARALPQWLFHANVEVVHALDLGDWAERPLDESGLRWAGEADFERLVAFGIDPAELRSRFARGARVAILEQDGRVAAWNWFETDSHDDYDWLRFTLSPGEIWGFNGRVAPAVRGRGAFARVRGFAARDLAREGYRRIVSNIDALNRSSLRARAKTGSAALGRFFWIRALGVTLLRVDGSMRVGRWGPQRRLALATSSFNGETNREAASR